jgi:hypothetical protein
MKRCTIVGHNGWTDYISQYALRRHFIKDYDECILFIDSMSKYSFVKSLYPEDNIIITVPKTTSNYDGINTCLCCHTLGSPFQCPRSRLQCQFIDYNHYPNYVHIKLNAFDNYSRWEEFFKDQSFLTSMYRYYNLNPIEVIKEYKISIHTVENKKLLESFDIKEEYIVVHENKSTGLFIHPESFLRRVYLDNISQSITDTLFLLREAKEIHCIDSVYLFLIVMINIQYNCFENTPIYVYRRSTDTNGPYYAIQSYLPQSCVVKEVSNE